MTHTIKPTEPESLKERLAAIEHERWADWQKWVHKQLVRNNYGEWVLPEEVKFRWEQQIEEEYEYLSEKEKDSDREQVDRYWPIIEAEIAKREQALLDEVSTKLGIDDPNAYGSISVRNARRAIQQIRARGQNQ